MTTTTERMLNTVGKRTFIKSLCYKKEHGKRELGKEDVEAADWPDSKDWQPEVLATKTTYFNRICRENKECEALKMCYEARKISIDLIRKARELYEKHCC